MLLAIRYTLIVMMIAVTGESTVQGSIALSDHSIDFYHKDLQFKLTPKIIADNKVHNPDHIRFDQRNLTFVYNHVGQVTINVKGDVLSSQFHSLRDLHLQGLIYEGQTALNGPKAYLSQGSHSWSNSGWLRLGPGISLEEIHHKISRDDTYSNGLGLSRGVSVIVSENSDYKILIGSLSETSFVPWIAWGALENQFVSIRFGQGSIGESKPIKEGESFIFSKWNISSDYSIHDLLSEYAKKLNYAPTRSIPKVGWNSWYELWSGVAEWDIMFHARTIPDFLQEKFHSVNIPAPKPTIVIDDGWSQSWGDWRPNHKFPDLNKLVGNLKELGIDPGIWIAPFLVSKHSPIYKKDSWMVQNLSYSHPTGRYKVLDGSHPEVQDYLKDVFIKIKSYGFEKVKIDFLMTGALEGKRFQNVTGLEAYHMAMRVIRQALGSQTYILGCGAPIIASLPYVNSIRVGADIALNFPGPTITDVALQARNIGARYFFCNHTHCDGDPLLLRNPHTSSSRQLAAWVVAMTGGGLMFSDDFRRLSNKAIETPLPRELLKQTISGLGARPSPAFQWKSLPTSLISPSVIDRITNSNRVIAPSQWTLPSGEVILLNYSRFEQSIDGTEVPGRSALKKH